MKRSADKISGTPRPPPELSSCSNSGSAGTSGGTSTGRRKVGAPSGSFLPASGDHVLYSETIVGTDGEERMGVFRAVVKHDGSGRVDNQPLIQLAAVGDNEHSWWEPFSNVYEAIQPGGPTLNRNLFEDSYDHFVENYADFYTKPVPSEGSRCQGICRTDFPTTSAGEFVRLCELACDERERLDADALHVKGGQFLSPHIKGILSHASGKAEKGSQSKTMPLRHYHLVGHGGSAANACFRDMGCSSASLAKPRRKVPGVKGERPRRCEGCQSLYRVLCDRVKQQVYRAKKAMIPAEGQVSRDRNDLLTNKQQFAKLHRVATKTKYLTSLAHRRQAQILKMLAESACHDSAVLPPSATFQPSAVEHSAVFEAVCHGDLAAEYFRLSAVSSQQADAAMAMLETCRSNMQKYLSSGSNHCFRYNPLCFSMAIEIFSSMSVTAYDQLRVTRPDLPTARYLRKVIHRHQHQRPGILRSEIRDFSNFLFRDGGFSVGARVTASKGCLALDSMTIQQGLRWHNSTGEFAGLAEARNGSGMTPQQMFIVRAKAIAARAKAIEEGEPEEAAVEGDSDGESAGKKLDLASQHLVVYYTAIKGKKLSFIVARCDLANVTTRFLRGLLVDLVRELSAAQFTVVAVSFDGASENRRLACQLCTVATKDLVASALIAEAAYAAVSAAADHPIATDDVRTCDSAIVYASEEHDEAQDIIVAIGAVLIGWKVQVGSESWTVVFIPDAPHGLKKLCNSFELRHGMELDGCPVNMKNLETVYSATHLTANKMPGLKVSRLTAGHFHKNCLSRMNVSLATQVFSQTMIDLFNVTLKKTNPALHKEMKPHMRSTLLIVGQWNHVFDIMNSRTNDKKKRIDVSHINQRKHRHVKELLVATATIVRWRLQAVKYEGGKTKRPKRWLSKEAGDDCSNIGIAVAALASLHAETEGGPIILRRLDQDCCEHHFGNVRQRGGHGGVTSDVAKGAQMASSCVRFAKLGKSNSRGARASSTASEMVMDPRNYMPTSVDKLRESKPVCW